MKDKKWGFVLLKKNSIGNNGGEIRINIGNKGMRQRGDEGMGQPLD